MARTSPQRETALVLQRTGLSPLGPLACNTAAPDESDMPLLSKVGVSRTLTDERRALAPLMPAATMSV